MSWLMTSHWIYYRCTSGHPVQLFLLVRRDFSRCPASQYAQPTTTIFPRPTPVYHGYIYRCIHPRWCYAVKSSWPLKQRHLDLCSLGVSDSHFISLSVWHMHTFVRIGQLLRFTQHWMKSLEWIKKYFKDFTRSYLWRNLQFFIEKNEKYVF